MSPAPAIANLAHGHPMAGAWPLLGMSFNVPLFPDQASGYAPGLDYLYFALLAFSTLVMMLVLALVLYFGIKYRAGAQVNRLGRITNTMPYELSLIVAFTVIGLSLFTWAAILYFHAQRPPADTTTYYVVAKQWMWKVWHPGGQEEINALHVPTGRQIKLVMTSQDVIHSFYVPSFRVKQDVLPDQYTSLWFTPTRPGTYHLYCAEYCGTEHSSMIGSVVVMNPASYQQWLSAQGGSAIQGTPGSPQGAMFTQGRTTFTRFGCNACHTRTSDNRAPRLDGIFDRPIRLNNGQRITADEQYIRESILNPNAKISAGYAKPSQMPTYQGQCTEKELADLVNFIKSIREGWPLQDQLSDDAKPSAPNSLPDQP